VSAVHCADPIVGAQYPSVSLGVKYLLAATVDAFTPERTEQQYSVHEMVLTKRKKARNVVVRRNATQDFL